MPPTPVVLIASVGRTDLQVLLEKDGQYAHCSVKASHVRKFHSALLSGKVPYVIGDSLKSITKAPDEVEYLWDAEKGQGSVTEANYTPCMNEKGALILVTPKLAETVASFTKQRAEWNVVAAIIINTNRSQPVKGSKFKENKWLEEPFGAGPILSKWLAEKFGFDCGKTAGEIGANVSGWIDLLDGDMIQPGRDRDNPLNRVAVQRLDAAMKKGASIANESRACLMIGGGIPSLKEVISACAAFRFERRVFPRGIPEIGGSGILAHSDRLHDPLTPVESFRFRSHARDLIKIGDFSGAYRVVENLGQDPIEKPWVDSIKQIADYLAGLISFDQKSCPEYLKEVLTSKSQIPNCLLAAIRVEAALSIPRIPEAVFWTFNFFEVALGDFISRNVCKGAPIDWDNFEVQLPAKLSIPPALRENLPRLNPQKKQISNKCMDDIRQNGQKIVYKIFTGFEKDKIWLDAIDSPSLKDFNEALNWREHGDWGITPRLLRNGLIHKSLTPKTSAKVAQIFNDAGLWNVTVPVSATKPAEQMGLAEKLGISMAIKQISAKRPGENFMNVAMVRNIFEELDLNDPAGIYRALLDGLIGDLEKHEIN